MCPRSAAAILLVALCWAPAPARNQAPSRTYQQLVDDYRRYGASAVPAAAALTADEIAAGRHAIAASWEVQRAAAILHTEAALALLNERDTTGARRQVNAAADLLDDVVRAEPAQMDFAYRWYALTDPLLREFRESGLAADVSRRKTVRFTAEFLKLRRQYRRRSALRAAGLPARQ